jgi:DNA-binding XRE family transcriptional regulator
MDQKLRMFRKENAISRAEFNQRGGYTRDTPVMLLRSAVSEGAVRAGWA